MPTMILSTDSLKNDGEQLLCRKPTQCSFTADILLQINIEEQFTEGNSTGRRCQVMSGSDTVLDNANGRITCGYMQ